MIDPLLNKKLEFFAVTALAQAQSFCMESQNSLPKMISLFQLYTAPTIKAASHTRDFSRKRNAV